VVSRLLLAKYTHGAFAARSACVSETGFYWRTLENLDEVYGSLQKEAFDLFIADCRGASTTALPFVENLCGMQKGLPVFLICDQWELDTVVRAIRLGVKDVFASPLDVKALIARAAEQLHKKQNGQMGTLEATQWSELIMLLSGNTSMFPPRNEKENKATRRSRPKRKRCSCRSKCCNANARI